MAGSIGIYYKYSAYLAKQGIIKELNSYRRDYTVGERMKIVVVNGSAVNLLTHKYAQIPGIILISFCSKSPKSMRLLMDNVEIECIDLFKKDRYIGKINEEHTVLFA